MASSCCFFLIVFLPRSLDEVTKWSEISEPDNCECSFWIGLLFAPSHPSPSKKKKRTRIESLTPLEQGLESMNDADCNSWKFWTCSPSGSASETRQCDSFSTITWSNSEENEIKLPYFYSLFFILSPPNKVIELLMKWLYKMNEYEWLLDSHDENYCESEWHN